MDRPLPCFVCRKNLTLAFSGKPNGQPADAVMFHAYGQYGSTAFDPQDDSQLQVNVCDECLNERRDLVWHARYIRQPALVVFSEAWNPDREPHA